MEGKLMHSQPSELHQAKRLIMIHTRSSQVLICQNAKWWNTTAQNLQLSQKLIRKTAWKSKLLGEFLNRKLLPRLMSGLPDYWFKLQWSNKIETMGNHTELRSVDRRKIGSLVSGDPRENEAIALLDRTALITYRPDYHFGLETLSFSVCTFGWRRLEKLCSYSFTRRTMFVLVDFFRISTHRLRWMR